LDFAGADAIIQSTGEGGYDMAFETKVKRKPQKISTRKARPLLIEPGLFCGGSSRCFKRTSYETRHAVDWFSVI